MSLQSEKGGATLTFTVLMSLVLATQIYMLGVSYRSANRQLLTAMNDKETYYASEIGALNAYAKDQVAEKEPIKLASPLDWGIRRYQNVSMESRRIKDDYCGVARMGSDRLTTTCLRKIDAVSQCQLTPELQTISFESYADGRQPVEGDEISEQFKATHGVSLCIATGSINTPISCQNDPFGRPLLPKIVKVGAPKLAFAGYLGFDDMIEPGSHGGSFFLSKSTTAPYGYGAGILISYESPVARASGAVLNLDTDDARNLYTITAIDSSGLLPIKNGPKMIRMPSENFGGNFMIFTKSSVPGSFTSKPGSSIPWGFQHEAADIKHVFIQASGSTLAAVDNLSGAKCVSH